MSVLAAHAALAGFAIGLHILARRMPTPPLTVLDVLDTYDPTAEAESILKGDK